MNYKLLCLLIGISALCGRVAGAADQSSGLNEEVERLISAASSDGGDACSLAEAYCGLFTRATMEQVEHLTEHENFSVALAAGWEKVRRTVPMGRLTYNRDSSRLHPGSPDRNAPAYNKAAVSSFLKLVRESVGVAVPSFWEKALCQPDSMPMPDDPIVWGDHPASIERIQNQWVVTVPAGKWFLPVIRGSADNSCLEPNAVRLKLRNWAAFLTVNELDSGDPYHVYAMDRKSGRIIWSSRVWSGDIPFRGMISGGMAAGRFVDLEVDDNLLTIFGLGWNGAAYIEMFDNMTGENLCRFSTGCFDFPSGAEPTALSELDSAGGGPPVLGPARTATISELRLMMKAKDRQMRAAAAWASVSRRDMVCDFTLAMVPELTALLKDDDAHVRAVAAWALGEIRGCSMTPDANTKAVIPAIAERLKDEDWHVRAMAAWALSWRDRSMNPMIPSLTELLHDKIGRVGAAAAEALPLEKDPATILAVQKLLKDKDGNVRAIAADALRGSRALWDVKYVEHKDAVVLIPAITDLLGDKDPTVRAAAAQAFERGCGDKTEVKAVIPALINLLKDEDVIVREATAKTLGSMKLGAKAAVPTLTELLKDNDWRIRLAAAEALGEIGPDAKSAAPVLIELLKKKDWHVCGDIGWALREIEASDNAALMAQLGELLRNGDQDVRAITAIAISRMELGHNPPTPNLDANTVVADLTELLKDKYWYARLKAAKALGSLEERAKSAVPALAALLKDKDMCVRVAAIEALEDIGPQAKSAIPELRELLEYKNECVRWPAERALQKIDSAKP